MAKKKLKSGFQLDGIAPNILLQHIENTAPFLFQKEIDTTTPSREYLAKLVFYKKNLKQLNNLSLSDYFHLCVSAHWATAGTFVPTDVDNQIREKLWKHPQIKKHLEKMVHTTIASRKWDYSPVSHRVSFDEKNELVMSTHEGTWFSVAIGAYCACIKYERDDLAELVKKEILAEINNHETLLTRLFEQKQYINFITAAPLVAHNFGDLDRVMIAWQMHETDEFCKSIFKLGHEINNNYSKLIVLAGTVNKEFTANENHRHMSLRVPKCLRKSNKFLIHVGPFLDKWGELVATSDKIEVSELAEIIVALFEGSKREKEAIGYGRALNGIINKKPFRDLEQYMAFDVVKEIQNSKWFKDSMLSTNDFEKSYIERIKNFTCPKTNLSF